MSDFLSKVERAFHESLRVTIDPVEETVLESDCPDGTFSLIHENHKLTWSWESVRQRKWVYYSKLHEVGHFTRQYTASFLVYAFFPCLSNGIKVTNYLESKNSYCDTSADGLLIPPVDFFRPEVKRELDSILTRPKVVITGGASLPHGFRTYFEKSTIYNLFGSSKELGPYFFSTSPQGSTTQSVFEADLNWQSVAEMNEVQVVTDKSNIAWNSNSKDVFLSEDSVSFKFVGNLDKSIDGNFLLDLESYLCEFVFTENLFQIQWTQNSILIEYSGPNLADTEKAIEFCKEKYGVQPRFLNKEMDPGRYGKFVRREEKGMLS